MSVARLPLSVDQAAPQPLTTQLKEQLKWLIALGQIKPGDRLPKVHDLADRVGINRNTVAQAYAELGQEGFLIGRQGQGTFVADSEPVRLAITKAELAQVVDDAMSRAQAMGYTAEEFVRAAGARAHIQTALRERRRALFVECNWPEVTSHARTMANELGMTVDGVHLDDIRRNPETFRKKVAEVDLVLTTLFHIEETQAAVGEGAEVIGLAAGLEMQFLRALAQLERGTKCAVACLDQPRSSRVQRMLVDAGAQHLEMEAAGVDDEERLRRVTGQSEVAYVSEAAYPEARRILPPDVNLRTYRMVLDRAGIEMVKARLAEFDRRPPEHKPRGSRRTKHGS